MCPVLLDHFNISLLLTSIPSYLIEVIPEFKVNGELIISGNPMKLGEELIFNTDIKFSGRSVQANYDYKVIAGSYLSVNAVAGSVSANKLSNLLSQLNITKSKLESNDEAQISDLDADIVLGDVFYTGVLGYFTQLISYSQAAASHDSAHYSLSAGYGTVGYVPNVNYLFGLPIAINTGGIVLDIPMDIVAAVDDGDNAKKNSFVTERGVLSSALEHIILEQMFYDAAQAIPSDTVSAVKAIQIASVRGQKIYKITQENSSSVLPNIMLGSVAMEEIQASLSSGKEIITHTEPISVFGYTGAGYIIIDP